MDRTAIDEVGIPGYELMSRAGAATVAAARDRFSTARHWLVCCGAGNNAGDGYVIARLAHEAGVQVTAVALVDPRKLAGDAAQAFAEFSAAGLVTTGPETEAFNDADLIFDALLGTGLDRPVSGAFLDLIERINAATCPVVAVDLPSGLNGESGLVMGAAVRATLTVTFVGRKQGLYLGNGPEYCGELLFADLDIPATSLAGADPVLQRFTAAELTAALPPRQPLDHKGRFGHVLVVGGNLGMGGAPRLSAEAALRSGAGLVSVAVQPEVVAVTGAGRPELMVAGVKDPAALEPLLRKATVIALGPGLGHDDWARALWDRVLNAQQPLILDADALNLLAEAPRRRDDWILTPHPGEAARLLGCSTADVQADRLGALQELHTRFGGTVVLKGYGTLVGNGARIPWLIDRGNPGMATAGMGDLLTGMIAGLRAQFAEDDLLITAAAVFAHATAGDRAAVSGQRGLVAGDLLGELRPLLNPAP